MGFLLNFFGGQKVIQIADTKTQDPNKVPAGPQPVKKIMINLPVIVFIRSQCDPRLTHIIIDDEKTE